MGQGLTTFESTYDLVIELQRIWKWQIQIDIVETTLF